MSPAPLRPLEEYICLSRSEPDACAHSPLQSLQAAFIHMLG